MSDDTVTVLMATYNDWPCVAALLPRIDAELASVGRRGSVVVVDDGSIDLDGKDEVSALSLQAIDHITCLSLIRNLGNQRAVATGIAHLAATGGGAQVIVMDSDHEDDPGYIPALLRACEAQGNRRVIFAERTKRSEGRLFRLAYGTFKRLFQLLTGHRISVGNYSVVPRGLLRRVAAIGELWSHYPAAIMRARIPFATIPAERAPRFAGKSKMSLVPLVVHALSGFAVHAETIGARVLVLSGMLGVAAVVGLVTVLGLKMFTDAPITGWTSQFGALLLVMVFQLAIAALLMVFIVVSVRMQLPLIPLRQYQTFIDTVEVLLETQPATQGGERVAPQPAAGA
jgi:hypothetical protein